MIYSIYDDIIRTLLHIYIYVFICIYSYFTCHIPFCNWITITIDPEIIGIFFFRNLILRGGFSKFPEIHWQNSAKRKTEVKVQILVIQQDLSRDYRIHLSVSARCSVYLLLMVQKSGSPVEVGSLSHFLQGFIHFRWCRISSTNSTIHESSRIFRDVSLLQQAQKSP